MWIKAEEHAPMPGAYWGVFYFINRPYTRIVRVVDGQWWPDDNMPFYYWSKPVDIPDVTDDVRTDIEREIEQYRD